MQDSVFDNLALLVVVRNLQRPLGPQLDIHLSVAEASELVYDSAASEGYDPMERAYLVVEDKAPVGWISHDCLDAGKMVSEIAIEQIRPSSVLSADTTALEMVQIFATTKMPFFFVLDHSQITGTLDIADFIFGLPFKLCLFALTLSLEDNALRLLLKSGRESWEALPPNRRNKGEKIYRKRFEQDPSADKPPYDDLLRCTLFCDKGTILKKRKVLSGTSGNKIESIFGRADKVRNGCAHTRDSSIAAVLGREELYLFIRDVKDIIEKLQPAIRG